MDDDENLRMRVNQLEEQLSNTLRAVDQLTADIQVLKDYSYENNKVVNSILDKIDDHSERMDKMFDELVQDRKMRAEELKRIDDRLSRLEGK